MDAIIPTSPCETQPAATKLSKNYEQLHEWNEDQSAMFVCRMCNKTFYNNVALQNHKNMHHESTDSFLSVGDGEISSVYSHLKEDKKSIDDLSTFKFFPLNKDTEDEITTQDGLVIRMFSEDTTYIVVKLESDEADVEAAKRRRLEGVLRRTQIKPGKPPIDLRGPFTCTFPLALRPELQCRQMFFNCCEYSLHYREDHTKRRKAALRCQVCERRLDRDLLPPPMQPPAVPVPTLTFSCRMCGQLFLSGSEYDEHNRLLHAKTKPHQCALCAKRFTQQGGLQQHMRMHTGIRPFGCTYCSKAFTQKAGLDQHLRTHTKIKPFKCVICTKGFSQSVHLRQHMRTHTNIQPFECYVCGKRFKQTSHLNFHLRSHGSRGSVLVPPAPQASNSGAGEGNEREGSFPYQLNHQTSAEYLLHYNNIFG